MRSHALYGETRKVIRAFETARALLGHAATLRPDQVDEITSLPDGEVPYAYARNLVARQREETGEDGIVPVLPHVDVTHGRIKHTTCTGGTEFDLVLTGHGHAVLHVERPGESFSTDDGRDVAISWALGAGDALYPERAPAPHRGGSPIRRETDRGAVWAVAYLAVRAGWDDSQIGEVLPKAYDLAKVWKGIGDLRHAEYAANGGRLLQAAWETRNPGDGLSDGAKAARRLVSGASRRGWDIRVPTPDAPAAPVAEWERELLGEM